MRRLLSSVGIIPVITLRDLERAVPLAETLAAVGMTVLEVTLRTDAALDAIAAIAARVPGVVVGAGTVTDAEQLRRAANSGARFVVSPGFSAALAESAGAARLPLLPGVATPTELMAAVRAGLDTLKFFPAEQVGGVPMLKALGGPFPNVTFCPTGGISAEKVGAYLALANVAAVGMSSIVPVDLVDAGRFDEISTLAAQALALRPRAGHAGRPTP